MQRILLITLSVLACLTACNHFIVTDEEELSDCSFDGDLSPGVQGKLTDRSRPPSGLPPGASVVVAVALQNVYFEGVCDKEVRWTPGPGSGTVNPGLSSTGAVEGVAQTTWVLPTVEGVTATLIAEVVNSNPLLQVVFTTVTATAGTPAQVARNPGTFPEPQSGTAGLAVASPPSVKVTDFYGGPAVAPVTFTVIAGGGSLNSPGPASSLQITTAFDGVATVPLWILGGPGTNTVQATVGSLQPVTFTANAAAAPAQALLTLAIHAGDNQSAVVNSVVAIPPVVILRNAQGFGVAGVTVTWQVVQGGGSFRPDPEVTPTSTTSSAEGTAKLQYFAPTTTGTVKLRATVTSQHQATPQFVEFTFTGLP